MKVLYNGTTWLMYTEYPMSDGDFLYWQSVNPNGFVKIYYGYVEKVVPARDVKLITH